MSDNYTIGSYTVSTQKYQEALNNLGFTKDSQLRQLDVNGDKVLTEDELVALDVSSDLEAEAEESRQEIRDKMEEQIEEAQEKCDKQLAQLYTQINSLQEQRSAAANNCGTEKELESIDGYASTISQVNQQINSAKEQIVSLLSNLEDTIEEIEKAAEDALEAVDESIASAAAQNAANTLAAQ